MVQHIIKLKLLIILSLVFVCSSLPVFACTTCNRPLQAAIFDASFLNLFLLMLLPFILVWLVVFRLYKLK